MPGIRVAPICGPGTLAIAQAGVDRALAIAAGKLIVLAGRTSAAHDFIALLERLDPDLLARPGRPANRQSGGSQIGPIHALHKASRAGPSTSWLAHLSKWLPK